MSKLNFEETVELYDFLRGECDVHEDYKYPKNVEIFLKGNKLHTKKAHLPKLTDEQAFLVIYALQEAYGLIPDTYEKCSVCGNLYDADEEGQVYDEDNYCDLCYDNLGFNDEQTEWIPCEKKLPQLNQEVRIKFNNGLEFQGGIDEKGWYVGTEGLMFDWFDTICLPDDITEIVAWKPM